jgi:flavin reductase (DIM6/NTAB) family NADH-FMN oxidoreductase RutF/rubredoxin
MDTKALRTLSYGLYIVSSRSGDKFNGQIANTLFQVTSDPLRVIASINKENLTHAYIEESGVFTVSVLAADAPMTLIGTFGFKSGRDIDKFSSLSYRTEGAGCPVILDHTLAFLDAKVVDTVDVGTHTLFVGEVTDAGVLAEGDPMTYAYYHQVKGGKTPEKAATFLKEEAVHKEEKKEETTAQQRYVCNVCGYIYDPATGDPEAGVPAGTPFEELPGAWVCPVCGASKEEFDKV